MADTPRQSLYAQATEHLPAPAQIRQQQDRDLIRDVIRLTVESLRNRGREPSVADICAELGMPASG